MMTDTTLEINNTHTSKAITYCQICHSTQLKPSLFLGYLPPVNLMSDISKPLTEKPSYPAGILFCEQCGLVQLGLTVNAEVLFPQSYPYTSSTTKILRDNFFELAQECGQLLSLTKNDLIVDIGSNDGNLLSFFVGKNRVLGITPETIGQLAVAKGIPTIFSYFNSETVSTILKQYGLAKLITATNVFAHIDDVHDVLKQIKKLLDKKGVFISESHYLLSLIETLQYDTIYHEHLRYYSVSALQYLFEMHDLEIFHCKKIPTHGGSIRVYAARKGDYSLLPSVKAILEMEGKERVGLQRLKQFEKNVLASKLDLLSMLKEIKQSEKSIFGISAPSRASTLINYCGIDNGILDCVCEVSGSYKIGKYIPGTIIPVVDEKRLFEEQPDYALLLSWHIADELIPKLRKNGYRGQFIVPLPTPKIVA